MKEEPSKPENNKGIEDSRITTRQTRLSTITDGKSNKPGQERDVIIRDLVNLPSTTYGTFGLYRYPAKFIPHVVAFVLENYASPGMKIFDPFAGYGTVGVVSRIYGHDYELWDLNPILNTLHSIVQLKPKNINVIGIIDELKKCDEKFVPDWSNFNYWFETEFVDMLTKAWGYYHSLDDEYVKLVLTIPLLKVSRQYSFDDMGRMKLSKSPKSKERIMGLLKKDWREKYYSMLEKETKKILKGLRDYQTLKPHDVHYQIRSGIDSLHTNLHEEKDILITSPPYLQSQEYIRQAKMDLFWLGHKESEIRQLSKLEVPYRNVEQFSVESDTYSSIRDKIKEDHIRKVYDRYFWAITELFSRLSNHVSSRMVLFVGRSSLRGSQVPIDRILAEHFTNEGWIHETTLVDTIVSRRMFSYRVNPATNMKDSRTSTEHLVILRRP